MPPKPPLQVDWVILQRFATVEDAQRWLVSPERGQRLDGCRGHAGGARTTCTFVARRGRGHQTRAGSVVIATRVRPGKEADYRAWERKVALAQSKARGLQGYRFEPPVPGVQEDYVAILRFDSDANLQAWPIRRNARSWSKRRRRSPRSSAPGACAAASTSGSAMNRCAPAAPIWKMDMLVLLLLYPIVYWFG